MTEQQKITFPQLYQQLDGLMLRDKTRFARRLHGVKKVKNPESQQAILQEMALEISQAAGKVLLREAARPAITYPENLPVSQKKQEILEAVRDHQVVIVAGETGSGKTTQLPKICMELGRGLKGLIGHTQPRRLAARTVANRIAEELQSEPGGCIGYKVRFSDHVSENTMVKLMTDGILLAEIQQDRLLMQYDTIIIDEAHERSLNIDFLLGYLKELLPRRPDLKIIITSATIDPERFSKHFNNAPIIEVSGRTYPVEVRYRPIVEEADDTERDQLQAIFDAVDELGREGPGDILIFMSGEREIRDTADALNKLVAAGKLKTNPMKGMVAAVSVGIVNGEAICDLEYIEDSAAETDMNVVMTEDGRIIEVQGTAEGEPFTHEELLTLLALARGGIESIITTQKAALEN